jgi:hypothetical protein
VYQPEAAASGGRHSLGLSDDFGVIVGIFSNDGLEDVGELRVFLERVWSWWNCGAGAEGDLGSGRIGGKEGEDVSAERFFVGKDVLSKVSRSMRTGRKYKYNVRIAFKC